MRNRLKFILEVPAGMEIELRNNGIIRQKNTVQYRHCFGTRDLHDKNHPSETVKDAPQR